MSSFCVEHFQSSWVKTSTHIIFSLSFPLSGHFNVLWHAIFQTVIGCLRSMWWKKEICVWSFYVISIQFLTQPWEVDFVRLPLCQVHCPKIFRMHRLHHPFSWVSCDKHPISHATLRSWFYDVSLMLYYIVLKYLECIDSIILHFVSRSIKKFQVAS